MTVSSPAARVLLIAEDAKALEIYCRVLEFVGYEVRQAANQVEVVGTSWADVEAPDVIKIPAGTSPDVLVADLFRRLEPRPVPVSV